MELPVIEISGGATGEPVWARARNTRRHRKLAKRLGRVGRRGFHRIGMGKADPEALLLVALGLGGQR